MHASVFDQIFLKFGYSYLALFLWKFLEGILFTVFYFMQKKIVSILVKHFTDMFKIWFLSLDLKKILNI